MVLFPAQSVIIQLQFHLIGHKLQFYGFITDLGKTFMH